MLDNDQLRTAIQYKNERFDMLHRIDTQIRQAEHRGAVPPGWYQLKSAAWREAQESLSPLRLHSAAKIADCILWAESAAAGWVRWRKKSGQ